MDIVRLSAVSPVRLAHITGGALVLIGVLWSGLRLWQIPQPQTAALSAQSAAADPAASAVAKWLGPGEVRLNVAVQGVMVRRARAVALLSVNEGPAQAYMVGETLLDNVTVREITPQGVTLDRAGKSLHFAAPAAPDFPQDAIVRVPGRG